METNYFTQIMQAAWDIMSIEFTIYGFTISFGLVFCFDILITFGAIALFKYLWG